MGKGKGSAPPEVDYSQMDAAQENMQTQLDMMKTNFDQQLSSMEIPEADPLPELTDYQPVDWDAKLSELNQSAKAEFVAEQDAKKGALDTILTSSLLDDEEVNTTQSLLKG